jgi:hypothetical protein
VDLERIYRDFVSAVGRLRLDEFVVPVRAKSDDVAPQISIDLLHVDGAHTDQATRDVRRFANNIRIGGLCFMDDIDWTNGSGTTVKTAVAELHSMGFVELYKVGTGALFQRVR